jgi:4-hydroxyphenylpyruvate dioxygenase-like putative hemolysin
MMHLTALAVGLLSLAAGQLTDKDGEFTEGKYNTRYDQFLMPNSRASYSRYVKQQTSTITEVVVEKSAGSEQGNYGMMQGDDPVGILSKLVVEKQANEDVPVAKVGEKEQPLDGMVHGDDAIGGKVEKKQASTKRGVLKRLASAGTGFSIAFLAVLSSLPLLAPRVRRWLSRSDDIHQQPLMELPSKGDLPAPASVRFSHVHMYVDSLKRVQEYKKLEGQLGDFTDSVTHWQFHGSRGDTAFAAARLKWLAIKGEPATASDSAPKQFTSSKQDIVEQLLIGSGLRITGEHLAAATRSVVLTSRDPDGVQFVMTAPERHNLNSLVTASSKKRAIFKRLIRKFGFRSSGHLNEPHHFDVAQLARYAQYHKRQGVAVLGFSVSKGDVDRILARYALLHPKLLLPNMPKHYDGTKVLEVYAYYKGEVGKSDADAGTLLRFMEVADGEDICVLPGIARLPAQFDSSSVPLYFDHWVSNVTSRTGFLDTLADTLDFGTKVDFNAGVVAAGEAQIESTVTGNSTDFQTTSKEAALRSQSQIYLPVNNALSDVGHVSSFLKQMGQGVQHIASRVEDLPTFIQRANDYRRMTGAGLSFLKVPQSYYGYLTPRRLMRDSGVGDDSADTYFAALLEAGIVRENDVVDLDVTREAVVSALPEDAPDHVVDCILRARYNNLYDLLRDHISEDQYLRIVRNNILVDIQGEDVLMQIFTAQILQRNAGEEAPFLEFIQRICSERLDEDGHPLPIRPGCGGFGIRNFLTLFLSIEVSAATEARTRAERVGDTEAVAFHSRMIDIFVQQLDESNPILTKISDAMTEEGLALGRGDAAEAKGWSDVKEQGQQKLMVVSNKYMEMVRTNRASTVACPVSP